MSDADIDLMWRMVSGAIEGWLSRADLPGAYHDAYFAACAVLSGKMGHKYGHVRYCPDGQRLCTCTRCGWERWFTTDEWEQWQAKRGQQA